VDPGPPVRGDKQVQGSNIGGHKPGPGWAGPNPGIPARVSRARNWIFHQNGTGAWLTIPDKSGRNCISRASSQRGGAGATPASTSRTSPPVLQKRGEPAA